MGITFPRVICSTRNRAKAEQIKGILSGLPIELLTLEDAHIRSEAVEDGGTLEENALKKAHFARSRARTWAIGDDSGIFINELGGLPGVRSARWAGPKATTEDIMLYTLFRITHVPDERRGATFRSVVALVSPEGRERIFIGEVEGTILRVPQGDLRQKMPYSSIFLPSGCTKTWSQMSLQEENATSHRGKAFLQVRQFFIRTFV